MVNNGRVESALSSSSPATSATTITPKVSAPICAKTENANCREARAFFTWSDCGSLSGIVRELYHGRKRLVNEKCRARWNLAPRDSEQIPRRRRRPADPRRRPGAQEEDADDAGPQGHPVGARDVHFRLRPGRVQVNDLEHGQIVVQPDDGVDHADEDQPDQPVVAQRHALLDGGGEDEELAEETAEGRHPAER